MRKRLLFLFFLMGCFVLFTFHKAAAQQWNPAHKVGTLSGNYHFNYNQIPEQLIELLPAAVPNTGLTYQWEQSAYPTTGFTTIRGAYLSSFTFTSPLTQTTYYRRKTTYPGNGQFIYSNVIKINVVSLNWEDKNYLRTHEVLTTGISTWTAVDQLNIGDKLQTTTYLDGLGRGVQQVSKEVATPATTNGQWGDMVQISKYDMYGRQTEKYLPYTTNTLPGKFKPNALGEQGNYYLANYNEHTAYATITFDNSPLNRIINIKKPGDSWNANTGRSANYDFNNATDDVKIFGVDYVLGNAPVYIGNYDVNTLYKLSTTDENGKHVIEYIDKSGSLILRKVQLDDFPLNAYTGWICTYNVYDDYGQLRYQIQPEGVKYLAANGWSFAGSNGTTILNEQVFQYYYDEKGRTIWKKSPGAQPLFMLYDIRDRVVFMQDGNQATAAIPQWTANVYDELDRPLLSTLYNTTKTTTQLQTDINNAPVNNIITINNTGTFSVTAATHLNPLTASALNNTANTTVLSFRFYDDYNFNAVKSFNNNYTNLNAYNSSDPNIQPIAKTQRTTGMPTGSMTRVLNTNQFLSATIYYDERGAQIQTLEDNLKNGTDITTIQYHFDGKVMSTCNDHTTPNTGYSNFKTLTKYLFDKLGRATAIQKQFGINAFKTITEYTYDDIGRLKRKTLDPGYTGGGNANLETLDYSYNIHSQLTGINKDYAIKSNNNDISKWGHYFGMYLGYDNRDNQFINANLTGQVTGIMWSTQGDDAQRRYNFGYDNAGRLSNADFTEKKHTGDAWSNANMDFSAKGTAGNITYDLNGNLLNMLHKGVLPGSAAPITVDDLSYQYAAYSNKLQSVTDNMTETTVNGLFGDFKDGSNGSMPDYVYDNNGNVVIDLNKNAKDLNNIAGNGIKYNFLDKSEEIRIAGKGVIKITYSAAGEKLQRKFISETEDLIKTTTYINQYIYDESTTIAGTVISPVALSAIQFEEGRIRIITPTAQNNGWDALAVDGNMDLPNGKRGAYDYYLMDYQGNVRMILTEETHVAANTATMETNRATLEESIFGQTGGGNEVAATRYDTPPAWSGNTTAKVSRLGTLSGHNTGPNTLQKVMAGDEVTATVSYYHSGSAGGNNTNIVNTLISSIITAISGSGAGSPIKNNTTAISNQLNANSAFINTIQPNGSNPPGNTPQAFLTVVFFDERFNFVEAADGGVAQQQVAATVGSNGSSLTLVNIKAPKNGYAYIYISNQSNNAVYFDDFKVQVTAGRIIEENHYYPYGLKIATLSAKKLADVYEGVVKNNYLYNGKELLDEDADLGWLDYGFRNYDPQIGRFPQLDPLSWEYPYYTPYQFAGNDPVANVDLDGLEPLNVLSKIKSVLKEGGEHVASGVRKSGLNIGKWTVSWFKDGVAFSHVFHSTGFLTQRLVSATIHLLSSASNIATSVPFKMRGDLANSFKIPNQQQQAINAYNSSLTSLNNAIEKGWHKAEKVNPDDPVLSGWQSWEVNDITGDKRINGLVQAITPVYPEAAAIPFPKLGKLFSWLRSIKFGAGAAKGVTSLEKASGSYLLEFQSGKFYAGKGLESRMMQSINRIETKFGDKLLNKTFYPAANSKAAFINEHNLMMQFGGPKSFDKLSPTYNLIFSPGKKLGGF